MLSISNPMKGAGQGNYYLDLARENYYANTIEPPGQWIGHGAELLNLHGTVERAGFHHLLLGFTADGQRGLVQNAGNNNRQSGWDLTFSAPKSVSVFWAIASPEVSREVELAHREAVETALAYVEAHCGITRRGSGGKRMEPAALTFATFQHSTSRSQDPQLHTHAVLLNLGLRADGTSGTLQSIYFFQQKMLVGALYQTELAVRLRQRLGLTIEPAKTGYQIAGVPEQLCRNFSQRRQAIERVLAERHASGAIAAKVAALDTRGEKESVSRTALFARWREAGESFGWGPEQALNLVRREAQQQAPQRPFVKDLRQAAATVPPDEQIVSRPTKQKQVPQKPLVENLRQAVASVPPTEQTPSKIIRLATDLAVQKLARAEVLLDALMALQPPTGNPLLRVQWQKLFDRKPWVPSREQFLRTEWRRPFANALWGPARKLRLPVIAVELPRLSFGPGKAFKPHWWSIRWKKDLIVGELRVQQRLLFPNAPKWSPVHGLSLPALRFTTQKSQVKPQPHHPREEPHHSQSH